ncbi:hypothetical protein OQA88_5641 [Cercophora sp. LCS_1]
MDTQHSFLLSPSEYDGDGLLDGIPMRPIQFNSSADGAAPDVPQADDGATPPEAAGVGVLPPKIMSEILSIDREGALRFFKWYSVFLSDGGGAGKTASTSLQEYYDFRIKDVGYSYWSGKILFSYAISLTPEDEKAVAEFSRPAWISLLLVNDLYSYEKEHWLANSTGRSLTNNGVRVIMQERGVDLAEARKICRAEIIEAHKQHLAMIERAKADGRYSLGLVRLLDGLTHSIAGNVVWSQGHPRYDSTAQYTPEQIGWMTNGNKKRKLDQVGLFNGVNNIPPEHAVLHNSAEPLPIQVIDGPSRYIASLPGKGIRSKVISALNLWYEVPPASAAIIKSIINLLHNASLMLDDIQDNSPLRRGKPPTHMVFGQAQTINSSSYKIAEALEEALKLGTMDCMRIAIKDSKGLYISQSLDLHWTANLICPLVEEYIKVLDASGLIRMLTRLLEANSPLPKKPDLHTLTAMLGRLYALRDDYQNLSSAEYTQTKGFCEDLDEGKYSLPLIHALNNLPDDKALILRNILTQRRVCGKSTPEHKQMVLDLFEEAGSFDYTPDAIRTLQCEVDQELDAAERETGVRNEEVRGIIELVKL